MGAIPQFSFPLKLGMLTIPRFMGKKTSRGHIVAEYLCGCGKTGEISTANLFRKVMPARSCSCLIGTTMYKLWSEMKHRCEYKKHRAFKDYGGRGIRVCERWQDFWNFLKDVGHRPYPNLSIDRIDVNGNYEPSNFRWATPAQQMRNRRCNKLTEDKAQEIRKSPKSQKELAVQYNVDQSTISRVLSERRWA